MVKLALLLGVLGILVMAHRDESQSDCVVSIITKHITIYASLMYIGKSARFEPKWHRSMTIASDPATIPPSDAFVLEICHPQELKSTLRKIVPNGNKKLLFVVLVVCQWKESQMPHIVKIFWKHYIADFVVLNDGGIYGWFPFRDGNCANTTAGIVKLVDCDSPKFDGIDLFPPKIPRVFSGCPVHMRLQILPPVVVDKNAGALLDLIHLLENNLNLRFGFTFRSYSNFTKFSSERFLVALSENEVTLMPDGLTEFKYENYDFTDWYFMDPDVLCLQRPRIKPNWIKIGRIVLTQSYLIVPLSSYVLITYIFAKIIKSSEKYACLVNIFFYYFRTISSVTNVVLPKNSTLRILFGAWLIFCLILTCSYNTILFVLLHNPTYEVQNVDKLLNTSKLLIPMYYYSSEITLPDLEDLHTCKDLMTCFEEVSRGDAMIVIKKSAFLYNKYKFIDDDGEPKLHCFGHTVDKNYMRVYARKNFYLLSHMTRLIERTKNAGIFEKKINDFLHREKLFRYRLWAMKSDNLDAVSKDLLKFNDFIATYFYLFIGISLSTLALIAEIVFYRIFEKPVQPVYIN